MTRYYDIILQDLLAENSNPQEMQDTPYSSQISGEQQIKITYGCMMRALRLKQRISLLIA